MFLITFNWNGIENCSDKYNTYILDVLVRIIAGYIYELRRFFFAKCFCSFLTRRERQGR